MADKSVCPVGLSSFDEQAVNTLAPQKTMVSTNGRMAAESIQCIIFFIL
jgi:hypothetical protein